VSDWNKNIEKEFVLLNKYLQEYINRRKPVSLKYMLKIYDKYGYIERGIESKDFVSFDVWKKLERNKNV